jgi:hypothetical protein
MTTFKLILEQLFNKTYAKVLKVAIGKDGRVKHIGNLYDTHYELLDKHPQDSEDYVLGFATPSGTEFLTRKQALRWIKEETPEIYKEYIKIISKAKPPEPEYGYKDELESIGYRKALGIA